MAYSPIEKKGRLFGAFIFFVVKFIKLKKINLMLSLFFIATIFSCSKSQINSDKKNSGIKKTRADYAKKVNATHQDNAPCKGAATNCIVLDEIKVRPKRELSLIIDAGIANGNAGLADVFNSYPLNTIGNQIGENTLLALQNGTLALKKNYENEFVVNYKVGYNYQLNNNNFLFTLEFQ